MWGHIDDMLVASENFILLKVISNVYQELFKRVYWTLNLEKSVLFLVKKITFLWLICNESAVTRSHAATDMCRKIVEFVQNKDLKPKQLQRIRGYLNYNLSFAGNYFSIINRILKLKNQKPFNKILII